MHLHCQVNADALSAGDQAGSEAKACRNDRYWPAGSAFATPTLERLRAEVPPFGQFDIVDHHLLHG